MAQDKPVVVLLVKLTVGAAAVPAGTVSIPEFKVKPVEFKVVFAAPLILVTKVLAVAHENPVVVLAPAKLIDGAAAVPAGAVTLAEIVPALKFPEPSRATIALAVFALVALFAAVAPLATLAAVTPPTVPTTVALCVPVTSPDKLPLKLPELVAVVALPFKFAVIVPALKLPDASRATNVFTVLFGVPSVLTVTSLVIVESSI